MLNPIAKNFEVVSNRILQACRRAQRNVQDVQLLAISKKQSAEHIRQLYNLGQRDFGENYYNELEEKSQLLKDCPDIQWSFTGTLQSNKIQKIVQHCDEIQTMSSEKHGRLIETYAKQLGKSRFKTYISYNPGLENTKSGARKEQIPPLVKYIENNCPHILLQGLMCIPPPGEFFSDPAQQLEFYHSVQLLAKSVGLGKLSLGMSDDLELAIQAGSNCVRIGTALFGARSAD